MSWKLRDQVCEFKLTPHEHLVLMYFARRANPDGSDAYPSIARLSWETGLSDRTVQRIVKSLTAREVLVRTRKPGFHRPASYRLVLSPLVRKPPFVDGVHKGDTVTPISPEKGVIEADKGDKGAEKGDVAVSPESSSEGSLETRLGDALTPIGERLCAIADCDGRGRGAHSLCVRHLGLNQARSVVA